MASLVAAEVGVVSVSLSDSFVDLGGDSLGAVRVIRQLLDAAAAGTAVSYIVVGWCKKPDLTGVFF